MRTEKNVVRMRWWNFFRETMALDGDCNTVLVLRHRLVKCFGLKHLQKALFSPTYGTTPGPLQQPHGGPRPRPKP
ncbi:hypothetical protein CEXT_234201 [Caerostris extrusa]|uniref:Uncharacterized protein n=1 Tax=Caerostris extrusa TaxID=172846 RepID=A0AAV4QVC5_CAEEX|nr:hypothetical protein CEXT_234201 [Caerostris extrusa]